MLCFSLFVLFCFRGVEINVTKSGCSWERGGAIIIGVIFLCSKLLLLTTFIHFSFLLLFGVIDRFNLFFLFAYLVVLFPLSLFKNLFERL